MLQEGREGHVMAWGPRPVCGLLGWRGSVAGFPFPGPGGREEELGALAMLEWFLLERYVDSSLGVEWI